MRLVELVRASTTVAATRGRNAKIAALAEANGVTKIALELHGNQCVYNVPSLLKLRGAIGPVIGANLDPSHLFWMGADPLIAAEELGEAVYHVHAKDTFLNAPVQATTSLLENGSLMDIPARSWSYITLGFGHGGRSRSDLRAHLDAGGRIVGGMGIHVVHPEEERLVGVEPTQHRHGHT